MGSKFSSIRNESKRSQLFFDTLAPICLEIEESTGLPAPVIMAQMIIESGWGGSSMTREKNNILGIKANAKRYATFKNVNECIDKYVYTLIENPKTKAYYGSLRRYLIKYKNEEKPKYYIDNVLDLIAEEYNPGNDSYSRELDKIIDRNNLVQRFERIKTPKRTPVLSEAEIAQIKEMIKNTVYDVSTKFVSYVVSTKIANTRNQVFGYLERIGIVS